MIKLSQQGGKGNTYISNEELEVIVDILLSEMQRYNEISNRFPNLSSAIECEKSKISSLFRRLNSITEDEND